MPGARDLLVEGMVILGKDCRWNMGPSRDSSAQEGV